MPNWARSAGDRVDGAGWRRRRSGGLRAEGDGWFVGRRAVLALWLVIALAGGARASAAPGVVGPSREAAGVAVGGATYDLLASVFGTAQDGLIGEETSSGYVLRGGDRLVALPACTESSCPWLGLDAGVGHRFGPQTACAEADGNCWVEIVSVRTGACAVAPVLDRGPLFVRDNWWAARWERTYRLERGVPAAEAAREGADLGFGPGISDRGYDVANDFTYAPAIDLAAGTWTELGLAVDQGVADVRVTLLWQAGIDHGAACAGSGARDGNATVAEALNLRAGPSTDEAVLAVLPAGARVRITGGGRAGFVPVRSGGRQGWMAGAYLRPDGGATGDRVAVVTEDLNLRAGPSVDDDVLRVMAAGSLVVLRGRAEGGFLAVSHQGTRGWAFADFLDAGDAASDDSADVPDDRDAGGGRAVEVIEDLNLRAGPGTNYAVLAVMPAGAAVQLTGDGAGGFLKLRYGGRTGWAAEAYLSIAGAPRGGSATVTEDLNLRAGPSTADQVRRVLPAGAIVTLTGGQENGFLAVEYGGGAGWAFAAYLT